MDSNSLLGGLFRADFRLRNCPKCKQNWPDENGKQTQFSISTNRSPLSDRRKRRSTERVGGPEQKILIDFSKILYGSWGRSRAISLPTTETETHKWPAHRTILFIFQSGALLTFTLFGLCSCFCFYFCVVPPIQRNQEENKCRMDKGNE